MATRPLDDFKRGPAQEADLDDVVRLIEEANRVVGIPPEPIREDLTWTWHLPTTDLRRDTRIVRSGDALIAYAEAIWKHPGDGGPLDLSVRVHPDHRDAGIDAGLWEWGERLANERGAGGVRAYPAHADRSRQDVLRSRGYVHVRSAFTMRKELDPEESEGTPPTGVMIRRYEDSDERTLFDVLEASFADHWGFQPMSFESFNEELHGEDWDPSLVFFADVDGVTVGYVVAFLFQDWGYIGMLGVLKEWRRRGIGTALLRRSFSDIARRGKLEVQLNVDAENADGAVALYEGVGMTVHSRYDVFDLGTVEAAAAKGRGPRSSADSAAEQPHARSE